MRVTGASAWMLRLAHNHNTRIGHYPDALTTAAQYPRLQGLGQEKMMNTFSEYTTARALREALAGDGMTYIRHIALNTGKVRDSYLDEVSEEAVSACKAMITASQSGGTAPIAGSKEYLLSTWTAGKCLIATVWANGSQSEVMAAISISLHSRCGAVLWRNMHRLKRPTVVTDTDRCPSEPWVATEIDQRALCRDSLEWIDDFGLSLAWAWHGMRLEAEAKEEEEEAE